MNGIGWAVRAMRDGKRVRRAGWNGGQYIALQNGYPNGVPINANTAEATGLPLGTVCVFAPYVTMRVWDTPIGSFVPWACSQTDVLAQDWEEAPPESAPGAKA